MSRTRQLFFVLIFSLCGVHALSDPHEHEHEEESGRFGPEKGITEYDEEKGFKLSPEALKNFELKSVRLSDEGPWTLPKTALVHSGEETNLFRGRDGFFKRIDFQTLKHSDTQLTLRSRDLRQGDEVVIAGAGFLRIAEIAATGGVSHGHSH